MFHYVRNVFAFTAYHRLLSGTSKKWRVTMYLEQDIIEQIKQGKTPPLKIKEGHHWRYDRKSRAMMEFHQVVYRDCEGYGYDVNEWETRHFIIGNTYKVQEVEKKFNIGISIEITEIEKQGAWCEIHYEITGGAE